MTDAHKVVKAIVRDISGRKGLGDVWEDIDPPIRAEIEDAWASILERDACGRETMWADVPPPNPQGPMKVYVLIIEDRHTDTDVEVFSSADLAIARAKAVVAEYSRFPEDIEERQIAGWLYYAEYSCEGDSVCVVEREVTPQ